MAMMASRTSRSLVRCAGVCIAIFVLAKAEAAPLTLTSAKGELRIDKPACFTREQLQQAIPPFGGEYEWVAQHNKAFSASLTRVGEIDGVEFHDVIQRIDDGYYDFIKVLAYLGPDAVLCPLYAHLGRSDETTPGASFVVTTPQGLVVGSKMTLAGTGHYQDEIYYVVRGHEPIALDFQAAIESAQVQMKRDTPYRLGSRGGSVDAAALSYAVPVYEGEGRCGACSAGLLKVSFRIDDAGVRMDAWSLELLP